MATSAELLINIHAQNKQAMQSLSQVNSAVGRMSDRTSKSFNTVNKSARTFNDNLIAIAKNAAAILVVRSLAQMSAGMFKLASDAIETEAMFRTVMGSLADKASEFTSRASKSLGLFETDLKKNVAILFNITKSMGLAEDQAFKMSVGFTALANDMASMLNLPIEEAFRALRAGLVGETEPLRRVGKLTTEIALQQFALEHGINKSVKKMSEQEKMLLRYIAVMQQSSNEQMDLARTLQSPANLVKVLKSNIDALGASLGMLLIPALRALIMFLLVAVRAMTAFANKLQEVFNIASKTDVDSMAKKAGDYKEALKDIATAQTSVANATDEATKAMKGNLQSFDELNVLSDASSMASSFGVDPEFATAFDNIVPYDFVEDAEGKLDEVLQGTREWIQQIKDALNFDEIIAKFTELSLAIYDALDFEGAFESLAGLGTSIMNLSQSEGFQIILDVLSRLTVFLTDLAAQTVYYAIDNLTNAIQLLADLLNGDWASAKETFKKGLKTLLSPFGKIIDKVEEMNGVTKTLAIFGLALLTGALVALGIIGIDMLFMKVAYLSNAFIGWFKTTMLAKFGIDAMTGTLQFAILKVALVIGAIVAMASIFIYCWQTSEKFREIVTSVFVALGYSVLWLWDKVKLFGAFAIQSFGKIGIAALSLYGVGAGAFTALGTIFKATGLTFKAIGNSIVYVLKYLLPEAFTKLMILAGTSLTGLKNIFATTFNGIIDIIQNAIQSMLDKINKLIAGISEVTEVLGITIPKLKVDLSGAKIDIDTGKSDFVKQAEAKLAEQKATAEKFKNDNIVFGDSFNKAISSFEAERASLMNDRLTSVNNQIKAIEGGVQTTLSGLGLTEEQRKASLAQSYDKSLSMINTAKSDEGRIDWLDNITGAGKTEKPTVDLSEDSQANIANILANAMYQVMQQEKGTEGEQVTTLEFDGSAFGRLIKKYVDQANRDSGTDLVVRGV